MDTILGTTAPAEQVADDARLRSLLAVLQQGVGHELPNQLIAVEGLARLLALEEGDRLSPDGREYLRRLTAAAEKMHRLVVTLAEIARLGRPVEPSERVDFAEVAAEAVALAKQLAPDARAEYHGPDRTVLLAVPRDSFRKLLVRLLRRAAASGTAERPARIDIRLRVSATQAELRVNAPGFVSALPGDERLLQPFASGDDRGLDLFLVRHLAATWGGTVQFETTPGQGTALVVTCPLCTDRSGRS